MECGGRRVLSSSKSRQEKKEKEKLFLENGGLVLEEIIVSFKGKHNIPLRSFSAEEIVRATNGFRESMMPVENAHMFKGYFEQRPILVKKFREDECAPRVFKGIRDMVMTSQMSHHKNVLKLLGCCLEFKFPAMVYEYAGNQRLSDFLYRRNEGNAEDGNTSVLPWKSRLRIAKETANVIVYLHTAFPTPIIYRGLRPEIVFIDPCGVAKLFDFRLCITLPPGESCVRDLVLGVVGFVDPEYLATSTVTTKSDVYSMGVLLLVLLTGQMSYCGSYDRPDLLVDRVKDYTEKDQFNKIFDPRILGEGGGADDQQQEMRALLALALSCVQDKGEDRPEMIDVAKELRRIERSVHPC